MYFFCFVFEQFLPGKGLSEEDVLSSLRRHRKNSQVSSNNSSTIVYVIPGPTILWCFPSPTVQEHFQC